MAEKVKAVEAQPLEVTPLDQWKIKTWLVELPSKRVVRVRTISLLAAIAEGNIPNGLNATVAQVIDKPSAGLASISDDLPMLVRFMRWVTAKTVVAPRIWEGVGECPADAVSMDVFTDDELAALTNFAVWQSLDGFASFRQE